MTENPAARGKAERVIHETLDEYEADPDTTRKPSLESRIAGALEAAGLLQPGSLAPGSGSPQRALGVDTARGEGIGQIPIPGVNAPLVLKEARNMSWIGCSKGHIKVIEHYNFSNGKQATVYKCGLCGTRL